MKLTRAVTHIRLLDANASKLAQLDTLASEYLHLCQQYVTAFCTAVEPDKYADAWLDRPLSARWQRVAMQHAAGVAQSWRTNRDRAYQGHDQHSCGQPPCWPLTTIPTANGSGLNRARCLYA